MKYPPPDKGTAECFDGYVEHIKCDRPELYEIWAFMAHNNDLELGEMQYDAAGEREFYGGLFAAIRRVETVTETTTGQARWRRCEYGTVPSRDHIRRRPGAGANRRPRTRRREHRPGARRRAASSSSTSSSDPGDPEGEPPRRRGELRHISEPLSAELNRIAAGLRSKGVVR